VSLTSRIQSDLTTAMKAREQETVTTLRSVVAAIKNLRVAEGHTGEVTDDETLDLITREAKKRSEAAEAYSAAGRADLAEKEQRELEILRRYLPAQLTGEELETIVADAIAETGAAGPGDLGRVMSAVMPQVKGRADGKQVNAVVRRRLSG
jgi:uncharacterized protein